MGAFSCILRPNDYPAGMSAIEEIEESIQTLPAVQFFSLLEWMTERHLKMLSSEGFESPELEAEILKSLEGSRHVVDANF